MKAALPTRPCRKYRQVPIMQGATQSPWMPKKRLATLSESADIRFMISPEDLPWRGGEESDRER